MAGQLKNILNFVNVPVGGSASLPHGLNNQKITLVPDYLCPNIGGVSTITADAISVTVTNLTNTPLSLKVLCESWHTIERAFGARINTTLSPQPFVSGGVGAPGEGQFEPARTLFVAQSWAAGADPAVFFTTIATANAQAALMNPTGANPVAIYIYPGTYIEDVNVVSSTSLIGSSQGAVVVQGHITYLCGQGVNAPQIGATENVNIYNIAQTTIASGAGANKLTFDTTAKTGGNGQLFLSNLKIVGFLVAGRANGLDNWFAYDTLFTQNSNSAISNMTGDGGGVVFVGCRTHALAVSGTTTMRLEGGESTFGGAAVHAFSGSANVTYQGVNLNVPITVATGATAIAVGCILNTTLTVAAGGLGDVRGSNIVSQANLIGPGPINRTTWNGSFATIAGPPGVNAVAISPPYPDALYSVQLQLTAGTGDAAATVSGKAVNTFNLTALSGNTFDYTIVHN